MKYTDEILKKCGINISLLSEKTGAPKLIIYRDDGYSISYSLTFNNIRSLQNNKTDFIDDIIDMHMKTYVKFTRKKKLLNLKKISQGNWAK